jgi:hypothetical protein
VSDDDIAGRDIGTDDPSASDEIAGTPSMIFFDMFPAPTNCKELRVMSL